MDITKLLFALIGGVIGFVASILRDYLVENKKEKIRQEILKKERLEELYILLSQWSSAFSINGSNLLSVMNNDITYNQYLDLLNNRKNNFDFHRIDMLVNIYATELDEYYKKVLSARDESNKVKTKFKYENGDINNQDFLEAYKNELYNFLINIEILQKKLALLINT